MRTRGGKSQAMWDEVKRSYLKELRDRTGVDLSLDRTNARWAWGPRGVIGILSAEERPEGDRWFMGLDEKAFGERQPLGVILLCEERDGHRVVHGFGASRWAEFLPRMSRDSSRGERKFDLRRRGDRYFLVGIDVTSALDDLSWLGGLGPVSVSRPAEAGSAAEAADLASPRAEHTFFARVRGNVLEPLDPTGLSDGGLVLVSARLARVVPSNATLRRVVAAGGPASLPPDFAEQHDAYAHGASGR